MAIDCLFGLTMDEDKDGEGSVMTYDGFMHILQKVAADDDAFRRDFEADPEGTMSAAGHELDLGKYHYSSAISLPTAAQAQGLLRGYLTDYEGDRKAGMGGHQNISDPVSTRLGNSSAT